MVVKAEELRENEKPRRVFTVVPSEDEISTLGENGKNPYLVFIELARQRALKAKQEDDSVYTEQHHIIPSYLNGPDTRENLVDLLYNDHVIAHYIRWIV